jgi:transcriptional regulator with XRE-family HTH domain
MEDSFGAALRARRRAIGLSQRRLADRIGLDFSYVSKLENGRLPPPAADTIVAICGVLGAPAEELLALVGKLPSDVQQTVSASKSAQAFLRETQRMGLKDDEWDQMCRALRSLRER